jgi:tRNA pseudouridine55 synthase
VVCGKGTYVRSLADDMAAALGGSAHLTALRRTRTGSLDLARHGVSIDELDEWETHLLTPAEALGDLPAITVSEETARGVSHGMPFVGGEIVAAPDNSSVRVLDGSGDLIAVYRRDGEQARPEVVLAS